MDRVARGDEIAWPIFKQIDVGNFEVYIFSVTHCLVGMFDHAFFVVDTDKSYPGLCLMARSELCQ